MELSEIYTQIITQNNKATHNRRHVPGATHKLEGVNPTCGDEIVLELKVVNGVVEDAGFVGNGCAISQASSSIMIDMIKGMPVDNVKHLVETFFKMIKEGVDKLDEAEEEELEDAIAFQGVAKMPARVKCATLAWHTLDEELKQ